MMREVLLTYTTVNGDTRRVYSDGAIALDGVAPSGGWLMRGLVSTRGGRIIPLAEIAEQGLPEPFFFKNGNPRYQVADLDHGTMRVQVSPGIKHMALATKGE